MCRADLGDGQEKFCLRKIKSRKLATPTAAVTFVTAALLLLAVLGGTQAIANTRTWGNVGTDFATDANWLGGTAPADNTTSDIGAFGDATVTNNPVFTADRSINGLQFNTGAAAWTFTGSGGTRTLTLGSGGITNNSANTQTFSATGLQLALGTDLTFAATSGALAIDSAVNNSGQTLTLSGASAGSTIAGQISGTGDLTKTGAGTWTLSGANTYSGATVVSAGNLVLSNTGGEALGNTSSIQVNSGATLALGANNQIGSSTGLILNGGTFVVGTASAGYSDSLGTLTLNANSVIDLGSFTGLHSLTFANSSGITWATNATLTISNWQGTIWSPGTAGSVLFGVGGLTSAQLSQVRWEPQGLSGAGLINANGELTPIPEARVVFAAGALLAFVVWRERKRILSLLRR